MLNRPNNVLRESLPGPGLREEYGLDRNPYVRLAVLGVVLLVPLVVVGAKLVRLQSWQVDEYVEGYEPRLFESLEPIPTTDGRILTGGTVLARDVARYQLRMHYRWLEEPADPAWLKRRARARLSGRQRSDRSLVAATQEQILAEREQMWSRVAAMLGLSDVEFAERRQAVQARVEHIIELVEERRKQTLAAAQQQAEAEARRLSNADDLSLAESVWQNVYRELTTPPRRRSTDPIEVREEFDYHVIAKDISFEKITDMVSRPDAYPGIDFEMSTERDYPQGSFAAHLIGSRQPVEAPADNAGAADNADSLAGVFASAAEPGTTQRLGQMGLEKSYDRYLHGRPGQMRIVRNAEGEIVRREVVRERQPGADIGLAIVEPLQRWAEERLDTAIGVKPLVWSPDGPVGDIPDPTVARTGPDGGCIIAMNIHTGEVLCAAAAPRFDLRVLTSFDAAHWSALQQDPRSPMFPRVTSMAIAPGSVFKTMTAVAAVESGIDPDVPVDCIGYLDPGHPERHRCYIYRHWGSGHGAVTLTDALCWSCNVYFFNVARQLQAGPLVRWSREFGFGQPTGIDLPYEAPGSVPADGVSRYIELAGHSASDARDDRIVRTGGSRSRPTAEEDSAALGLAIGQSSLAVTPLQILRLMAAIASGGELVTPTLVSEIRPRDGSTDSTIRPPVRTRHVPVSERSLHVVREGLELVVASPRGTGHKRVHLKEIAIAGKTGTAETGSSRDHAWFAGYAPADAPQVAFVVVLEFGGGGGSDAGPLARELVQQLMEQGLVAP